MQQEPTLPIKLDSTSNGEYAALPAGGAVARTRTYGVDPTQARRRAESDPVGRLDAAYPAGPRPAFATYGPRDAAQWRRCRAIQSVGLG